MAVLLLVAGPNGAGKTTLCRIRLIPATRLPFINADEIARERWPGQEEEHGHEASAAAAAERDRLIPARSSFITETVFSHPSKLELIRQGQAAAYIVSLHAVLVPEELSVARVALRARQGGHSVPVAKIRQRYRRLWPLLEQAVRLADDATVYDNTSIDQPHRVVARYRDGKPIQRPEWPRWSPIRWS